MKRSTRRTLTRALVGFAVAVALLLTLPTVTGKHATEAGDVKDHAEVRSAGRNTPPEAPRADREAHSDGGYWYWLERQGSRENSH